MNMALSDSHAFDTSDGAPALRPLAWGDLCARLVAAQDLRRLHALEQTRGTAADSPPAGSFHDGAAHMLERHDSSQ